MSDWKLHLNPRRLNVNSKHKSKWKPKPKQNTSLIAYWLQLQYDCKSTVVQSFSVDQSFNIAIVERWKKSLLNVKPTLKSTSIKVCLTSIKPTSLICNILVVIFICKTQIAIFTLGYHSAASWNERIQIFWSNISQKSKGYKYFAFSFRKLHRKISFTNI